MNQDADRDHAPVGVPMIRTIAMPADSNAHGDIFGGWLMSQMDLAGGNLAARVSHGRCVTVSVDAMSFIRPVKIGDEVSVHCELLSKGPHLNENPSRSLAPRPHHRRRKPRHQSRLHLRSHRRRRPPAVIDEPEKA